MTLESLIIVFQNWLEQYGDMEVRAGTGEENYPSDGVCCLSAQNPGEPDKFVLLVLDDEPEYVSPPPAAVTHVPCRTCCGTGEVYLPGLPSSPLMQPFACEDCHGSGVASGTISSAVPKKGES